MQRVMAAIMVAGVYTSPVLAQTSEVPQPHSVLTLGEALRAAGLSSPTLAVAAAGLRAAEVQGQIARLRPNPSLIAETENVAGTGIYEGLQSAETTLGVSLPLELGGKRRARIAVARAQHGRAEIEAAIAGADLRLRVTEAYTQAVAWQRRLMVTREQVAVATEGVRVARLRVRAGRASPLEESRAGVTLANATAASERAERSAEVAAANLTRLIGQPVAKLDLVWFERIDGIGPTAPVDTVGTLAAAAARADVGTATAQVALARSQRIPDLTVSASARRLEQTNDTAAVLGISVPLPLFNDGLASVRLAFAQRAQADARQRLALLDAEQAIASAQAEVANAAATSRTAGGPALAAAQEATRIARIGYREGKFGQLDLIEAERTLLEIRTAAIDALAAYHEAKARLERLTARVPSEVGRP
jgi:outer membrane protein, heavy metal efflux system